MTRSMGHELDAPLVTVKGDAPGLSNGAGCEGVTQTASRWCAAVARLLGLAPPPQATLVVHDGDGIAWAQGSTIHLYRHGDGSVNLEQLPHELVHLVAGPSPSRFVAEGLAVHVAAELGLGPPCWPSYRLAPSLWVAALRRRRPGLPSITTLIAEAESLRLAAVTAPDALARAWTLYIVAGSFVGHLFTSSVPAPPTAGEGFWRLYSDSALWRDALGVARLERDWQDRLSTDLGADGRGRLDASLAMARRQYRRQR